MTVLVIDDQDVASQQAFVLLRTLVGLRLDALGAGAPDVIWLLAHLNRGGRDQSGTRRSVVEPPDWQAIWCGAGR